MFDTFFFLFRCLSVLHFNSLGSALAISTLEFCVVVGFRRRIVESKEFIASLELRKRGRSG